MFSGNLLSRLASSRSMVNEDNLQNESGSSRSSFEDKVKSLSFVHSEISFAISSILLLEASRKVNCSRFFIH